MAMHKITEDRELQHLPRRVILAYLEVALRLQSPSFTVQLVLPRSVFIHTRTVTLTGI